MEIKAQTIEVVSIDSLIPHPKNCHHHSEEQIERLIKLIEYQGFRIPIIVQKGTNLIVAGHGRTLALKKMGETQVPVIYQEFESEAQLYAFLVSDNAIGKDSWAKLDLQQINSEIMDIGPVLDLDLLGINEFTIEPFDKLKIEPEQKEKSKKFILEITFPNDMEMMDIHDDLVHRGYTVKIKNK